MLSQLSASAAVWGMRAEDSPPPERLLEDGDEIGFGGITLKVIHTPGHSPGGIALYTPQDLFVGDTLFAGSIGRTDFPGGDYGALIRSVRERLFVLGTRSGLSRPRPGNHYRPGKTLQSFFPIKFFGPKKATGQKIL